LNIASGRAETDPDVSPGVRGKDSLSFGFGGLAMARAIQFTIGRYMVAVAIIGYFCAFPELAVLLGIFVASLLFVAPVVVVVYFVCRFSLRNHRPSTPRP
jgi:hypothetical protein